MQASISVSKADLPDLDLFQRAGLTLTEQAAGSASETLQSYLAAVAPQHAILIHSSDTPIDFEHRLPLQLPLPFKTPERPAVVKLAPKASHVYLNYGVYDVFRDVPILANPAVRFEANDISLLGELVQIPENALRTFSFVTTEVVSELRRHLSQLGLDVGMSIPSWNRDYRRLLGASP